MMKQLYVLMVFSIFGTTLVNGQLKNIIVENYYVTDFFDATDTLGGPIQKGNITYRIFIEMEKGSKLKKVYGDENHPLIIESSLPFYNHKEDGETFGKDFNINRYKNGVTPLDTWITIGQCSSRRNKAIGVLKAIDPDGSFVGGENNDGGTEEVSFGLLTNSDPLAGIPIVQADGMYEIEEDLPQEWVTIGFIDPVSNRDTSIFSSSTETSFYSTSHSIQNEGISNQVGDVNAVIIAQLTTKGLLNFSLNLEIEFEEDGVLRTVRYVSNNDNLLDGEEFSPLLNFPLECGCTDPNYLEASSNFGCSDDTQCETLIVFGCMDSLACNYNPAANYNLSDLCCYVGYCNDLELDIVCPELPIRNISGNIFDIYPVPVQDYLVVEFSDGDFINAPYQLFSSIGIPIAAGNLSVRNTEINVEDLPSGSYILKIFAAKGSVNKSFIKL